MPNLRPSEYNCCKKQNEEGKSIFSKEKMQKAKYNCCKRYSHYIGEGKQRMAKEKLKEGDSSLAGDGAASHTTESELQRNWR